MEKYSLKSNLIIVFIIDSLVERVPFAQIITNVNTAVKVAGRIKSESTNAGLKGFFHLSEFGNLNDLNLVFRMM